MDKFDRKIIGYESEKETLRRISHILKHTELYKSKGKPLPRGLLLAGEPGTGKTTMAECLIEDCGRKAFMYRKDSEDEFYESLKEVFEIAKKETPSVVLLEDMDKYSSQMSRCSSEWTALQTAIDECKGFDVFIVATVNDTSYIAQSLLRPGRYDYIINVPIPQGDTAIRVMKHYLSGVELGKDVEVSDIAKALSRKSCATLETVVNIATLNSIYEGKSAICKQHFIDAILQVVYQMGSSVKIERRMLDQTAWHEAAHTLVAEILSPGRTAIVTLRKGEGGMEGMTDYVEERLETKERLLDIMAVALAGKACTETLHFELDLGASDDLQKALKCAYSYVTGYGGCGIVNVQFDDGRNSEDYYNRTEMLTGAIMEQQYQRAREILGKHREELQALHDALLERETLLSSDIIAIVGNSGGK